MNRETIHEQVSMASIAAINKRLRNRRRIVRALVSKDTHETVAVKIQMVHALLEATSAYLTDLEAAVAKYNLNAVATAKKKGGGIAKQSVKGAAIFSFYGFAVLRDSADLISKGKDAEAAKHLFKELLAMGFKIGVKLTPLRYVKDAAEALEALQDILRTTKANRLRKQQVKVATDLLNWLDAVAFVILRWCYAAELFLLGAQGKGNTPESTIWGLVDGRLAVAVKAWP